ncbi:MAG: hypothetical protein U0670_22350 [Anaerolineae bacterium]
MPTLARWHIKTGLIFFAVGLALGVVLAAAGFQLFTTGDAVLSRFSPSADRRLDHPVDHRRGVLDVPEAVEGAAAWKSAVTGWCVYVLLSIRLVLRAIGRQ